MHILLIEDNTSIIESLSYSLSKAGYIIDFAKSIKETEKYLSIKTPNIILLDVTLPDGTGFSLYANIIKDKQIPTIFLTAKDSENDIVKGLKLGAEDYITKPFKTLELITRIDKVLSRFKSTNTIIIKDITYDKNKMQIYKNKECISLTPLETKIVDLLFLNINKTVSRAKIIDLIWEYTGNDVDDHTVTVYLKRIREKLDTNIIKTIKGIGYMVEQ